jgi:hypothetical protein
MQEWNLAKNTYPTGYSFDGDLPIVVNAGYAETCSGLLKRPSQNATK